MKLQNMKNLCLLLSASLLIASCGPTHVVVQSDNYQPAPAPVEDLSYQSFYDQLISLWKLDQLSGIWICVDAKRGSGFQTLFHQRELDLYRCGMDLVLQLQLGLGTIPLRTLVL